MPWTLNCWVSHWSKESKSFLSLFCVPKKSDYIFCINPDVKEKRNFIQRAHAGKIDHLFADVRDVAKGTAHCYIHGCDCAIPRVDMIISGTACTSISGERSSNSEFATCFASGLGASGVTYQCGYRDMFSVAKPLLSLYENVNKVSQRSLAHRVYRYILGTKAGLLWDLHYLYIYILCSVFHCWKITKESNFVKQIDGLRGANTTVNKCVYKYMYI